MNFFVLSYRTAGTSDMSMVLYTLTHFTSSHPNNKHCSTAQMHRILPSSTLESSFNILENGELHDA